MARHLLLRALALLVSLAVAGVVVFAVLRLLPGDAAGMSLGIGTTGDQLAQLRSELGADQPVAAQLWQWVTGLASGDLGTSFVSRKPVGELVAARLPVTLPLTVAAFVLSVLISVPLGIVAAVRRRGAIGVAVSALTQLGVAVPVFWVGVMLVWVFALKAGVLDELQIHQIPVLFGAGRRLFDVLPSRIELEIVRVIDTPEATHIRYRVRR
jgi:peptide/nickel transport system permease protein